ncbi:MAG TPA: MAPEG family protein [Rhodanobacteraceae bacterium]|nr:MAPEG family protein [Rhodanobacteraceae bacterium]
MAIELSMLGWSVVLGLVYVFTASMLATRERGMAWNAGNRDGAAKALGASADRASRAVHNFLETFAFFAAAVLALVAAGKTDAQTALAAQAYFWARVAYLPCYVIGIPYLRSAIWAVSLAAIVYLLYALLV